MYVCIDSSARRPNHTEFEQTPELMRRSAMWQTPCLGSTLASGRRLGGLREASGEAPGRRPGGVREVPASIDFCYVWVLLAAGGVRILKKRPNRAKLSDFFGQHCQITISV